MVQYMQGCVWAQKSLYFWGLPFGHTACSRSWLQAIILCYSSSFVVACCVTLSWEGGLTCDELMNKFRRYITNETFYITLMISYSAGSSKSNSNLTVLTCSCGWSFCSSVCVGFWSIISSTTSSAGTWSIGFSIFTSVQNYNLTYWEGME